MRAGRIIGPTLWLWILVSACDPAGEVALVVDVRTDYAPGIDFVETRVTVDGVPRPAAPLAAQDWAAGARIAELEVTPGSVRILAELLDGSGAVVASRPAVVEVNAATAATRLIVRRCRDVSCPEGQACHAEQCVSEECTEENPGACGVPECVEAAECAVGGEPACVALECIESRVCFSSADHDACGADERCDVVDGCVSTACDASPCRLVPPQCGCEAGEACRHPGPFDPPECAPAGTGTQGAPCAGDADCAAGFDCLSFDGSSSMGECAELCEWPPACPAGSTCAEIGEALGACASPCDPFRDTGCQAGLGCQLLQNTRVEDGMSSLVFFPSCQSGGQPEGAGCGFEQPCVAGTVCAQPDFVCREVCLVDAPSCTAGTCLGLNPQPYIDPMTGSQVGYCDPT